jgi:predicted nucleotidyltransferase
VARRFVAATFPAARTAFLAGSVVRGEGTPTSDLDLVVVGDEGPWRASYLAEGWPVEAFVHTEASLRDYFGSDAARRMPSLPRMCAEGLVVVDPAGRAEALRAEARALLDAGPPALEAAELAQRRYGLTDLVEDLEGAADPHELRFIAAELAQVASDFRLAYHRRWSGRGKWALRALAAADPDAAVALSDALAAAVGDGRREPLVAFVDATLAPAGGRLFAGFSAGKPTGGTP